MHLALVSQFDARSPRAWSGIPFRIARALEQHVERLTVLPPCVPPRTVGAAAAKARARLSGTGFLRAHTEEYARAVGAIASRQVADVRPDAVLSIGSLPLSFLDAGVPAGFWIDATFESHLHAYEGYAALGEAGVAEGHRVEARALARADLAAYPSTAAAASAVGYYGTPAEHVAVVPFGANLDAPPRRADVEAAIAARASSPIRMLFLGGDWTRKGGDVAVRVAERLNAAGTPAVLDVVGARPPADAARPFVTAHGFLHKDVPAERAALETLLMQAHALVMPVRAEAFGCVFCEAAAYGIPSLTTRVGGAPDAVADGVSGLVFDARPDPAVVADVLARLVGDPVRYAALALSARGHYEQRLNWDTATGTITARLRALV